MATRTLKLKVLGRVQRVGYRRHLLDLAQQEGIAGYARNEKDGSVTVLAQGEEAALKRFARGARNPQPPAVVKRVEEATVRSSAKLSYFEVRSSGLAEELQEGLGAMQSEFRDYRQEFRGFTGEFRDYRDEFRDYRQEFRGFTGEFRDYRDEFRDYRQEFRGFAARTDENFGELGQKYGEISKKLTEIMEALAEQAKKTTEMLEAMREESRQGRETLAESLKLLKEAVERLPRRQ